MRINEINYNRILRADQIGTYNPYYKNLNSLALNNSKSWFAKTNAKIQNKDNTQFNFKVNNQSKQIIGIKNNKPYLNIFWSNLYYSNEPEKFVEALITFIKYTGQRPLVIISNKGVARFNIRKGSIAGFKIDLHKQQYFRFITLVNPSSGWPMTNFINSSRILTTLVNYFNMTVFTTLIIVTPLLGSIITYMTPKAFDKAGTIALWFSVITWIFSLPLLLAFDRSTASYQFVVEWTWPIVGNIAIGLDGISILFVILTTMLTPLCILSAWSVIKVRQREFFSLFLLRESRIILVFRAMDLLLFYVSFEAVLIPRFLLIGVWGSRERKIRAANRFFLYTLFGSVWRLLALALIYFEAGTLDITILMNTPFSESRQYILWLAFFIAFAVKVPRLPFHIWLPEAHVESPTAGSVILAALLLKFGLYAFIRRSLPLFPFATFYFTPLVQVLALIAVIYTSLTAIRQTDRKRIIAYSSVAHRNLGLLGVFSATLIGLEGALFLGLSHGIVSGALFLCVGILYDRHHSRIISYYGGLAQLRPIFVMTFRLFTMANIALPGTSSFVGELMILLGAFLENHTVAVIGASGRILGGAYSLWLLNRIAFGYLKNDISTDRNRREFVRFIPLILLAIIGGIMPQPVLDIIHTSCSNILENTWVLFNFRFRRRRNRS